jgi:hypothetical protein
MQRFRMRALSVRRALPALAWLAIPWVAAAQTPVVPGGETYGPAAEIAHVVGAWEFETLSGTASPNSNFGQRYCQVGGCDFYASLRLPAGARVTRLTLDACDATAAGYIFVELLRTTSPATLGSNTVLGGVDTGAAAATPGCAISSNALDPAVTIDNEHFNYQLYIQLQAAPTPNLSFAAVRVYYTLQVSPAPATATFGDVPTSHPFFQFIEALVKSGITAGCGGGNYCPDDPLTRGQMAVFLSKALGLHFAP